MNIKQRLRKRLGCIAIVLLSLVLFAALALVIGRHLWASEPAYWTQNQSYIAQTDPDRLTDVADRAFNRILSELSNSQGYKTDPNDTDPRAMGVRSIRLDFDEANAWLATRLDDWLANQKRRMPDGVSDPMLQAQGDLLVAAFRYRNRDVDQVFSVLLSMTFLDNGQAVLSIDGLRGGRLPLPTSTLLDKLPRHAGEDARGTHTLAVLLGEAPFDPILPIDGDRQARIIDMRVDPQSVSLIVQAEPTER